MAHSTSFWPTDISTIPSAALRSDIAVASGVGGMTRNTLGFGCLFADINLDGALDLILANGHIDDTVRSITIGYRGCIRRRRDDPKHFRLWMSVRRHQSGWRTRPHTGQRTYRRYRPQHYDRISRLHPA